MLHQGTRGRRSDVIEDTHLVPSVLEFDMLLIVVLITSKYL